MTMVSVKSAHIMNTFTAQMGPFKTAVFIIRSGPNSYTRREVFEGIRKY